MHRQPELAYQSPVRRLVATQAPAKMLDIDRAHLLTCRDGELIAVNDDANRNAVHFGNAAGDRLRARRLRTSQQ